MASKITSLTVDYSSVYSIHALIKENIKAPRHWPLWGEFPAQRASNAENVSIWWHHHEHSLLQFDMKGTRYQWSFVSEMHRSAVDSPTESVITGASISSCYNSLNMLLIKHLVQCRWSETSWRPCDVTVIHIKDILCTASELGLIFLVVGGLRSADRMDCRTPHWIMGDEDLWHFYPALCAQRPRGLPREISRKPHKFATIQRYNLS